MSVTTTKLSETYCDTLRLASHQRISTGHGPHRHLGTNPQAITTVAVMTHKSDQDTGGTCHARPLDSPVQHSETLASPLLHRNHPTSSLRTFHTTSLSSLMPSMSRENVLAIKILLFLLSRAHFASRLRLHTRS